MAEKTFEERLERLGTIVDDLEAGELSLEQGVALFKEGCELSKGCSKQLQQARNEVKVVSNGQLTDIEDLEPDQSGS